MVSVSLSNTFFQMNVPMMVLPASKIPNGRSGVILGQRGFMNRLMVEATPRSILLQEEPDLADDSWGALESKAYLDSDDVLHKA